MSTPTVSMEPVQAFYRWYLPQDEPQAYGPLPRRTGVANNRDNPHIFHDTLERIMNTGNLTYRELVA